jgi:hypothetical protein
MAKVGTILDQLQTLTGKATASPSPTPSP